MTYGKHHTHSIIPVSAFLQMLRFERDCLAPLVLCPFCRKKSQLLFHVRKPCCPLLSLTALQRNQKTWKRREPIQIHLPLHEQRSLALICQMQDAALPEIPAAEKKHRRTAAHIQNKVWPLLQRNIRHRKCTGDGKPRLMRSHLPSPEIHARQCMQERFPALFIMREHTMPHGDRFLGVKDAICLPLHRFSKFLLRHLRISFPAPSKRVRIHQKPELLTPKSGSLQ